MISYALKHAWFWLALTGIVSCWFTLVIVPGRRYGGLWGRILYCLYITWLDGTFCLGIIWHLDPHRMPRPFCIFQTLSFSIASFALTGWAASFTIATSFAVFRPQSFDNPRAALTWHNRYIPTLVVFPLLSAALYTTFVFKLDAIKPVASDDLHCDVTDPLWLRLLGYGGMSPLVSTPFLALSAISAFRLYQLHNEVHSSTIEREPTNVTTQQSYELQDKVRRRSFRLTAFFPYPTKQIPATPHVHDNNVDESSKVKPDAIVDGSSFKIVDSFPDLAFHGRLDKEKWSSSESICSNTMPVFASNPSLSLAKIPVPPSQSASEHNSRLSDDGHINYGIASTIEDQTVAPQPEINDAADYAMIGLAVTTDEHSIHASSRRPSSEIHGAHDFLEIASLQSKTILPSPPSELGIESSIILPQQRFFQNMTGYDHTLPQSPSDTAFPLSSSTRTLTCHLPPTSMQSVPSHNSSTLQDDSGLHAATSVDIIQAPINVVSLNSHCGKEYDNEGEEDGHIHDDVLQKGPIRTVEPRDPRERLGVYNPTPPNFTTATKIEFNRQSRQKKKKTGRLLAAMRRMVLFQIGFFVIQMLASLSIIIDIVRNKISAFGTQHVALILAAWGPFVLYITCRYLPIMNSRG